MSHLHRRRPAVGDARAGGRLRPAPRGSPSGRHRTGRRSGHRSSWLRDEIQRRIAEGSARTGGGTPAAANPRRPARPATCRGTRRHTGARRAAPCAGGRADVAGERAPAARAHRGRGPGVVGPTDGPVGILRAHRSSPTCRRDRPPHPMPRVADRSASRSAVTSALASLRPPRCGAPPRAGPGAAAAAAAAPAVASPPGATAPPMPLLPPRWEQRTSPRPPRPWTTAR